MIGRSIRVSYMMRIISVITILWQPLHGSEPSPPIWEVSYTKTIPLVDGIIDPTWDLAKPLTIFIREAIGADNPTEVRLRALYTDDMLFLLRGPPIQGLHSYQIGQLRRCQGRVFPGEVPMPAEAMAT